MLVSNREHLYITRDKADRVGSSLRPSAFTPPAPIAKSTGQGPRRLFVGDQEVDIPANRMLIPSHVAVHTHPQYWGKDSLEWLPSRWVKSNIRALHETKASYEEKTIITPQKGSFISWSEGIRNCTGKRFSQVEFVAAMATFFHEWRVDPVPEPSENMDMARKRVLKTVEYDTGQVLLLQMLHPEKAALSWSRR